MSKEKKISLAIVFGVLALTVFFFFEALNLTINGDFTRFFPWDEIDDVYYVESTEREETKTKSAGINDDFIASLYLQMITRMLFGDCSLFREKAMENKLMTGMYTEWENMMR